MNVTAFALFNYSNGDKGAECGWIQSEVSPSALKHICAALWANCTAVQHSRMFECSKDEDVIKEYFDSLVQLEVKCLYTVLRGYT